MTLRSNNQALDLTHVKGTTKEDSPPDVDLTRAASTAALKPDPKVAPPNPPIVTAASILGDTTFCNGLKQTCTFFYGKVWFYNAVLEKIIGVDWQTSKDIQIVHYPKGFGKAQTTTTQSISKPLVILPAVHDQPTLNILVSKALETERPVWFIGYPSTLTKHLFVSFQALFLCGASTTEIEILSDVVQLSKQDRDFLSEPKSGIYITKENAQSIHLTF